MQKFNHLKQVVLCEGVSNSLGSWDTNLVVAQIEFDKLAVVIKELANSSSTTVTNDIVR